MNELYHHGVKGQRWGVRRYQNKDGSLTNAGKKRYKAMNGDFVKQYKEYYKKEDARVDDMDYNVYDAARRLSDSSKRFRELNQKKTDALIKNSNNPSYYTKKGWRAKKASDKYHEAAEKHRNAKGLSKIGTWIKKTIADDNLQRMNEWKITSKKDAKQYVQKTNELRKANEEAIKGFKDEQAGMILRDLGYEDTKKAREFIKGFFR